MSRITGSQTSASMVPVNMVDMDWVLKYVFNLVISLLYLTLGSYLATIGLARR